MFTVRDLRERLVGLPDDLPVILEKDAEGNGYSPLASISYPHYFQEESSWSGYLLDSKEDFVSDPDDPTDTYEDYIKDSVKCVVLGPVN